MMKNLLKNFFVVMIVLVTSLGFVACKKNNASANLTGKWIYFTETYKELLIINADNSVVSNGQNGSDLWVNVAGNITVKGNKLTYVGSDGRNFTGTFKLQGSTLVINENGKEKTYNKMVENFSMEGKWKVTNINSFIKAVKDEVTLPVGTVNGEVIPTTVKTSNFSGEFVKWAISQYFGSPEFTSTDMKYRVIKEGKDTTMTKKYQMGNNLITVNGKVGSVDINNSFMIFQNPESNESHFFMTKENIANMFVGYGLMLSEGKIGDGDNETLKTFKQSFMEAFRNYAIIITMTKQ